MSTEKNSTTELPPQQVQENEQPQAETKDEFPHKVFIGNLNPDHNEEQLTEHFKPFGKIEQVLIIYKKVTKYAFIAFSTAEEAEKAVKELQGKPFLEKEVKIELARPKKELAARKAKAKAKAKARRKAKKTSKKDEPRALPNGTQSEDKEAKPQKEVTEKSNDDKTTSNEAKTKEQPREAKESRKTVRGKPTRGRGRGRGRRFFAKRAPKPAGEPSPTTLFVANLPFSLSDEGLRQVFDAFNVVSAHVVRRSATQQSKGFGFVELKDQEEQQRVLKEIGEVEINGRVLNISVAHSEPYVPPEEASNGTSSGDNAEAKGTAEVSSAN